MEQKHTPELAQKLLNWYWEEGIDRADPYQLPVSRWLKSVATEAQKLQRADEALSNTRPSMAIWGPSQTGKSTLISAYVDSGATCFNENPELDGSNGGLHWPGGKPYFFMAPKVKNPEDLPAHLTSMVLNPFNKGMDGSACLTRFVPGTLKNENNRKAVGDPAYPVELKLVELDELWHALARGYSTECLAIGGKEPRAWDLERMKRATSVVLDVQSQKPGKPDRCAFEDLLRLTDVLNDLAFSDDRVFSLLSEDLEAWKSFLIGLFDEPKLLSSREQVWKLAEKLLWNDAPSISEWFRKLAESRERWLGKGGQWAGRRVMCSLQAASLFLNMGASEIAYAPRESNELSPRGIIQRLIDRLGCQIGDDCVRIGCDSSMPHRLGDSAETFSILQGLVWELEVPINLDNLPDSPFPDFPDRKNALKSFLEVSDILDFPGVGNETKSLDNRVIVDAEEIKVLKAKANAPDATPQIKERLKKCFTPVVFFKEILKRGKTASIVATYAKRLQIDAFSIFQGARGHACPNADQIINGIRSWWRFLCPEYAANPSGESPFPLNLVITWWAKQLNLATNQNDTAIYSVIDGIVGNLGIIKDPNVATTFAIHDHGSPDRDAAEIKQDFSPGSQRYKNITSENGFKQQFSRPLSKQSFDAMITDKLTGGAEFFFNQATLQMQDLAGIENNRFVRIHTDATIAEQNLLQAMDWPDLVPQPKVVDKRRDRLKDFLKSARLIIANPSDPLMGQHNRYLREVLNIRPGDIPTVSSETVGKIETILDAWVVTQTHRILQLKRFDTSADAFGLADSENLRTFLKALIDSLVPEKTAAAKWLKERYNQGQVPAQNQLQRLFAVFLSNAMVYGDKGPRTATLKQSRQLSFSEDADGDKMKAATVYFMEPLLATNGRIEQLALRDITPRKRPDLVGDVTIRTIFDKYHKQLTA